MLRNRSSIIANPAPLFSSPTRFFSGLFTEVMSPTSILDTKNFFSSSSTSPSKPVETIRSEPEAVGLALIDSFSEDKHDGNISKPISRIALFGSKLKVQIPTVEFGIKNESPNGDFGFAMSLEEMEVCEEYTCVITHGSNPKTTHIFGDCIVEITNTGGVDFLSFCHTCKNSDSHECRCEEMLFEDKETMEDAL